jgi:hypothetical protein
VLERRPGVEIGDPAGPEQRDPEPPDGHRILAVRCARSLSQVATRFRG